MLLPSILNSYNIGSCVTTGVSTYALSSIKRPDLQEFPKLCFIDFGASPSKSNSLNGLGKSKNDFPLDVIYQLSCLVFPATFAICILLPCSVLILSTSKKQSDVENLVKNCLIDSRKNPLHRKSIYLSRLGFVRMHVSCND